MLDVHPIFQTPPMTKSLYVRRNRTRTHMQLVAVFLWSNTQVRVQYSVIAACANALGAVFWYDIFELLFTQLRQYAISMLAGWHDARPSRACMHVGRADGVKRYRNVVDLALIARLTARVRSDAGVLCPRPTKRLVAAHVNHRARS